MTSFVSNRALMQCGAHIAVVPWILLAAATGCGSSKDAGVEGGGGNGNAGQGGINGTGSSNGTLTGTPPADCAIGSQGCYCDTIGGCATGQSCKSGVCCSASTGDCTFTGSTSTDTNTTTGVGGNGSTYTGGSTGTSTSTDTSLCTPSGPTIFATGGPPDQQINPDTCGYTFSSSNSLTSVVFNESSVLMAIVPSGAMHAKVAVFYGDEHALTLGVRSVIVSSASGSTTTDYPVSPLTSNPEAITNPQTGSNVLFGDQAGLDPSLRPMWPVLFITDVTNDAISRVGDWQYGGRPYNPSTVYGTWKAAVRTVDPTQTPSATITPDADPAKNNWDLGTGADSLPSGLGKNEGYGAEIVWYLALIPGHSYRVQAMVHDGDQNKTGGDVGEACVNFCAGGDNPDGGTPPPPPPPPPQCQEGAVLCGPGGIDPSDCPLGYICANGCCTWNIG